MLVLLMSATGWRWDLLRRSDLSVQDLALKQRKSKMSPSLLKIIRVPTISTLLHGKIKPKDWQVASFCGLFLQFFRVVFSVMANPVIWRAGSSARRGHQGEYLDANPLERAPDGEVKVIAAMVGTLEGGYVRSGFYGFSIFFSICFYICFLHSHSIIHLGIIPLVLCLQARWRDEGEWLPAWMKG